MSDQNSKFDLKSPFSWVAGRKSTVREEAQVTCLSLPTGFSCSSFSPRSCGFWAVRDQAGPECREGVGWGGGVSIDWHHCGDLASQLSRFASWLKPPHIACACVQSHFSHVQLYDPVACSPSASSIHDILQRRILEWVALPSPGDLPDPTTETLFLSLLHWQASHLA